MQKQCFDRQWQFHLGDPAGGNWQALDDPAWRWVDLPHDWSIELERDPANPSGTAGGYFPMGRGWYRKNIDAPEAWRGQKVLVEFEGVYMNAEIWLNEHFIGRHPYGYTSFTCDLGPYLKYGEKNLLKVVVDNACQLNSRWYSGSGIYRHVWLVVANPIHVGHWGVYATTPVVTPQAASVQVRTTVENETHTSQQVGIRSRILTPDGALAGTVEAQAIIGAGKSHDDTQVVQVANPHLWSTETPQLYRVETEVISAGQVVDAATTTFGIRSLHVDAAQGFLLNGQPLKLKGGCVHHDNGVMGSASFDRSEERKVEVLKANGYNAIRCAHNPPAPGFLDACDRLGMLVIDEAFDCWRDGKNPYDYHVVFDDWWQRDIDSMVRRDRNHPSIVMWSIGNELHERDRPEGAGIARMLAARVRAMDPTRPITAAICGTWSEKTWSSTDGVFATLDIGGYNYQWRQYQPDHELHPQRIMAGTESFPLEALENWICVTENSYVIGDFVWTSLDYLGETGIGRVHFGGEKDNQFLGQYPWHQAFCGDIDLCGFKRPQSYYRDVVWGHGDKLYIAVHTPIPEGKTPTISAWGWPDVDANWTWPGHEGQTFKVDVYSACESVELFLNPRGIPTGVNPGGYAAGVNGQSLGVKPTTRQEKHTASFEAPYAAGELKAIGRTGNQPAIECVLHTCDAPARIHLTPDRAVIKAGGADLSFVTVEIVDAAGRMHPAADQVLSFTVEGEGSLAAVGSGNPVSTESYRGSQRKAYRGRCLAVVKSGGKPGEIRLRAQAEGLESAELVVHCVESVI
jgi:beta-galactosidase